MVDLPQLGGVSSTLYRSPHEQGVLGRGSIKNRHPQSRKRKTVLTVRLRATLQVVGFPQLACFWGVGRRKSISSTKNEARLNVRFSSELKLVIEQASAVLGQSVNEFAVSTLVQEARQVMQETQVTTLSHRDRDMFLAALEATDSTPGDTLKTAARRYKRRMKNG